MFDPPETQYARVGDGYVGYQVWGEGAYDLVAFGGGWTIEALWDHPRVAQVLRRLGGFARNIWMDPRGGGASSRIRGSSLETVLEDLQAVTAAVGATRPVLLGITEGAAAVAMFAATYPERVPALVLANGVVRFMRGPDNPFGLPPDELDQFIESFERLWGTQGLVELMAPSMVGDAGWCRWLMRAQRQAFAPDDAVRAWRTLVATDAHHVLPVIQAPTLVLHRQGNPHARIEQARYTAEQIPGATFRALDGEDHNFFAGDADVMIDEIEEFLTGVRPVTSTNRVLLTVLFTDIVGSSAQATALGDARWRSLLDAHDAVVRGQLARFAGLEINTTGDGFLATFDGPARAVQCATELVSTLRPLGLEIRAGVHTGEVERRGQDIGGVAVHAAARVMSLASTGEVLVSRTVTDLVAGSGLRFEPRGEHELRGLPGSWAIYAVT